MDNVSLQGDEYDKDELKERVTHLWNLTKHLTSIDKKVAKNAQMYFVQNCRKLGNTVELPEKCFGNATMCSFCGIIWRPGNHTVRLIKAKEPSKAIKRLMRNAERDTKLPKCRATLIKKCSRNKTQKVSTTCLNCKKSNFTLLKRPKVKTVIEKSHEDQSFATQSTKLQGLNTSKSNKPRKSGTPVHQKKNPKAGKSFTPISKEKKFRKGELRNMLNEKSAPKKNSLNAFLSEL